MNRLANTIQLVRNLRKGKHDAFAIQKTLARLRNNASGTEHQFSPESNIARGQEPHRQINGGQACLPNLGVRNQGEE